ncbi:Acetyl esterase/lipase [Quadrisphaera granulorum]|uniref:Acetyl esterase/lipase n=1 Tax=Quadrisphaera granulorum TaxID=317664 RepID=A0A316A8T4_9ACTN|nr:alpha/beta hydrolase [Quadrisphaera granulorum]PWJ53849.1 acetyl esterase/lipase [Quadrisphaera granulorum]SZE96606.1 Acetyl esterase/lipase [Quadrisphaera granulorum]
MSVSRSTWSRPSLLRWVAHVVLRRRGVKRTLMSVEATQADRLVNVAAGEAPPPRRVLRSVVTTRSSHEERDVVAVVPRKGPRTTTIVYFHGGAYINPMVTEQWDLVAALALQNHARVLVPAYRLAPQTTAETEVDWAVRFVRDAAQEAGGAVVVAGDSAGGGLAAAVALQLAGQGIVAHAVLFSPWLDVSTDNPGIPAVDRVDPSLAVPGLQWAGRAWAGNLPLDDPRVSPLHGDLAALPPTTVLIGTHDLFLADCRDFADRAEAAGADLRHAEFTGAFHVFAAVPFLPESKAALRIVRERLA